MAKLAIGTSGSGLRERLAGVGKLPEGGQTSQVDTGVSAPYAHDEKKIEEEKAKQSGTIEV